MPKCHDCVKNLVVINAHAFEIHKAVTDFKVAGNPFNVFKVERHLSDLRSSLDRIEKCLAERITNEAKECV